MEYQKISLATEGNIAIASATSDHQEGRESFLEKRDAKFTGN
ncbi:MAG: hypothetical protein P8J55_08915 [Pseudomonadales bacterium]|jgi:1,4-dihydroxy-2-naphthoyl-CoA synthase|nr:hypothetical protein [Pseudomonadales bacterium]